MLHGVVKSHVFLEKADPVRAVSMECRFLRISLKMLTQSVANVKRGSGIRVVTDFKANVYRNSCQMFKSLTEM